MRPPRSLRLKQCSPTLRFRLLFAGALALFVCSSFFVGRYISAQGLPSLAIYDVSRIEGDGGVTTNFVFSVSLSAVSGQTVTVNYATANNQAQAGNDYTAQAGTLTFNPGETTKTITVPVIADCNAESDENFFVNLSGAVNASISNGTGVATIISDDNRSLSIGDINVIEGEGGGTTNAVFTVSLKGSSISQACGPVTVNYATANNQAVAG